MQKIYIVEEFLHFGLFFEYIHFMLVLTKKCLL